MRIFVFDNWIQTYFLNILSLKLVTWVQKKKKTNNLFSCVDMIYRLIYLFLIQCLPWSQITNLNKKSHIMIELFLDLLTRSTWRNTWFFKRTFVIIILMWIFDSDAQILETLLLCVLSNVKVLLLFNVLISTQIVSLILFQIRSVWRIKLEEQRTSKGHDVFPWQQVEVFSVQKNK